MLDAIINFVQQNPLLVVAVLFFIYKKWESSRPWPDFGGKITSVHSVAEWDALLASSQDKVVVVDAYATWCPPCKAAAPVYARLSESFTEATCVFAKFNTDEVRELGQQLEISAMPTFKIFKSGQEVDCKQGFPGEATLRQILQSHGAKTEKED